ncbi:MAG: zinc-binding dehydrogenase [Clostridia bacterium]|nr:zinc-binding dehydrogenase [Clostridia bacterium]
MKGLIVPELGKLQLVYDIPEPEMGPYDALVQVVSCGICNGTDTKVIEGHFKGFDTYPCVLGHEACGKIIAVGEKVRNYKVGDYVLRAKLKDTDKYYHGWGGFSERALVTDYFARVEDGEKGVPLSHMAEQIVPPDIDPVKAMMIITLKEVFSALNQFGVQEGKTVMINGCGPVGQAMVRFCKLLGVNGLIVSDLDEERLAKAQRLGADILINPAKQDVVSAVRAIYPSGVDLFIDAVGINALINTGFQVIKFNGKICVYGISPKTCTEIDWEKAPYNWSIQFVQKPTFPEEHAVHNRVVEFVRSGAINLDDFVSHVMPVEEFEEGFRLTQSKKATKVALTF